MKRIVCEMCENTQFVKENGMFVCQGCGCRYTPEDAKSLMVEVDDIPQTSPTPKAPEPAVPTPAPAERLADLKMLAQKAQESGQLAELEDICRQILLLSPRDSDTWRLKGDTIRAADVSRTMEAVQCYTTAFEESDDKPALAQELFPTLKSCFITEMSRHINHFENHRPVLSEVTALGKTLDTLNETLCRTFETMGLSDHTADMLLFLDNIFIKRCHAVCTTAWRTFVGKSYYRHTLGENPNPFYRRERRFVIPDLSQYRPTKPIWDTFVLETTCLIELLKLAEQRVNINTNPDILKNICLDIAHYEDCIARSGSWVITQGASSAYDVYPVQGWFEEFFLPEHIKNQHVNAASAYRQKARTLPYELEKQQSAQQQQQHADMSEQYWAAHPDEAVALNERIASLREQITQQESALAEESERLAAELAVLESALERPLPAETALAQQRERIAVLEEQHDACGVFKAKERQDIRQQLDTMEYPRLAALEEQLKQESGSYYRDLHHDIDTLKVSLDPLRAALDAAREELAAAELERTNRPFQSASDTL